MNAKKKSFLDGDKFFGILIFVYVLAYVYFYEFDTMAVNFFALFIYIIAFIKKVFLDREKTHFDVSIVFLSLFLLWGLLSFFWADIKDSQIELQPRMFFLLIIALSFYNLLRWYNIRNYFLWGLIFAGIINVFVFFNIIPNPVDEISSDTRFVGTLVNPNTLAIFMSFSIFSSILLYNFFLKNKNKYLQWFLYLNILTSLYIIFQTGSRKGIILGVVFLFLFFLPYLKSARGIFAGAFLAFFLLVGLNYLFLEDTEFSRQIEFISERFEGAQSTIQGTGVEESADYRLYLMHSAFDIWKENPVLGIGLNNFQYFFNGSYAHNNFIEIAANLGSVGFILYYLFYLFCLLNVLKIKDKNLKWSGIVFFAVFFIMEYAWVCYHDTIYIMMLLMVSYLRFSEKKEDRLKGVN